MKELITKILTDDSYVKRSTLSVTDINRGIKEIILSERYTDEIKRFILNNNQARQSKIFSIMGKAWDMYITKLCERDPDYMVHTTLIMPYIFKGKEYTISGEIDLFYIPTNTLIDNKLVSTSKYEALVSKSNAEYTRQLNGYVWLLKEGYRLLEDNVREMIPLNLDTSNIELVVALRDWNKFSGRWDSINTLKSDMNHIDLIRNSYTRKLLEYIQYQDAKDDEIPPCSPEERWETATTYPVFKLGSKAPRPMPRTANFTTRQQALDYIAQHKDKDKLYVGNREGGSKKCSFCTIGAIGKCSFYNRITNGL